MAKKAVFTSGLQFHQMKSGLLIPKFTANQPEENEPGLEVIYPIGIVSCQMIFCCLADILAANEMGKRRWG